MHLCFVLSGKKIFISFKHPRESMKPEMVTGRKAFSLNIKTKLISYLPKKEDRQTKCEVGKMDLASTFIEYNKYEEW